MTMTRIDEIAAVREQRQSRIRVRRVEALPRLIARAISDASTEGCVMYADHGGAVSNAYGYPAKTQAVGVCAVRVAPDEYRVLAEFAEIPANKVTRSGVAAQTLGPRGPWDQRYGQRATELDRLDIIARTLRVGARVRAEETR